MIEAGVAVVGVAVAVVAVAVVAVAVVAVVVAVVAVVEVGVVDGGAHPSAGRAAVAGILTERFMIEAVDNGGVGRQLVG